MIENTAEMHNISLPHRQTFLVSQREAGHQSAAAADVAVLLTCQRLHHLHPFATLFTKPALIFHFVFPHNTDWLIEKDLRYEQVPYLCINFSEIRKEEHVIEGKAKSAYNPNLIWNVTKMCNRPVTCLRGHSRFD